MDPSLLVLMFSDNGGNLVTENHVHRIMPWRLAWYCFNQAATRSWERGLESILHWHQRGHWPCQHLDFRVLTCRTMKHKCLWFKPLTLWWCVWQPYKLIHHLSFSSLTWGWLQLWNSAMDTDIKNLREFLSFWKENKERGSRMSKIVGPIPVK